MWAPPKQEKESSLPSILQKGVQTCLDFSRVNPTSDSAKELQGDTWVVLLTTKFMAVYCSQRGLTVEDATSAGRRGNGPWLCSPMASELTTAAFACCGQLPGTEVSQVDLLFFSVPVDMSYISMGQ